MKMGMKSLKDHAHDGFGGFWGVGGVWMLITVGQKLHACDWSVPATAASVAPSDGRHGRSRAASDGPGGDSVGSRR